MTNIVTVYAGPPNAQDQFLLSIYNRLCANTPAGYTILQHQSIGDLCDQVSKPGQALGTVEIISHGNPYYLGVILTTNASQLATALHGANSQSKILFSGCNTGTWNPNTNEYCISGYLASQAPCQVYGSMGYLNGGTHAEGTVQCSANDWGQERDMVYQGAINNDGPLVFQQKPSATMAKYVTPSIKALLKNERSPADLAEDRVLASLAHTAPVQRTINPQAAPNVSIPHGNDIYDLFGDGSLIRSKATGKVWKLNLDAPTKKALSTLWVPKPAGTAVVAPAQPAPATS